MITVLAILVAAPLGITAVGLSSLDRVVPDAQSAVVDLSGRWQLNTDLSDKPPAPPEGRVPGEGRGGAGRSPRGGGGGYPGMGGGRRGGGTQGGGGMRPGSEGRRPDPEEMAKMRDAMRAALDAPAEMIVTRKDDEVVFTAAATGDVTRILVTGKKMKTTAGGAEHEVKAEYKQGALVIESIFGPIRVVDTWRLSADGGQLERLTKMEGGAGDKREIRRIYIRGQV